MMDAAEQVADTHILSEQALLGACLTNPQAFDVASQYVNRADFSEEVHRHIWDIAARLRGDGRGFTPRLIIQYLGETGEHDLGGMTVAQYVARLASEAVTVVDAPDYARAIKDAADLRRISHTVAEVEALISSPAADPAEIAAKGIEALDRIVQSRARTNTPRLTIGASANRVIEQMEEARKRQGAIAGVSTGLPDLDRISGGLKAGCFYVLAGRPGMGKTALACSMAMGAARSGAGVAYISLEMEDVELTERCLADEAELMRTYVPYCDIRADKLDEGQLRAVAEAVRRMQDLPIIIEQEPGLNVSQVRARCRQMAQMHERRGSRLRVIFVDHIGLMSFSEHHRGNRYSGMTEISNSMKAMAKELGVAVVGLCQLNRGVESREDKRPSMADLRDSGAIEQDADMVILPYREAYYLAKKSDLTDDEAIRLEDIKNKMEIHIAKNRSGPECRVDAYCVMEANVIRSMRQ